MDVDSLLCSDHPLAQGFDLRSGSVSVTVPATTEAGADYAIVRKCYAQTRRVNDIYSESLHLVFGDSGNVSPEFTIV